MFAVVLRQKDHFAPRRNAVSYQMACPVHSYQTPFQNFKLVLNLNQLLSSKALCDQDIHFHAFGDFSKINQGCQIELEATISYITFYKGDSCSGYRALEDY